MEQSVLMAAILDGPLFCVFGGAECESYQDCETRTPERQ